MRTVRRLYFYAISLISLEVVIWGVIGLLRTVLSGGGSGLLASSLALTLVGLPVFLFHWSIAQRDALKDPDERTSRIRALFLYGVLAGTCVPMVQNGLAIFDRAFLLLFNLDTTLATIGRNQTWLDNVAAIVINAGAAAYMYSVLRTDWSSGLPDVHLRELRRLYRNFWMLYGLGLAVFGVQQTLFYLLNWPLGIGTSPGVVLANGLTLLVGGLPVWVSFWRTLQNSLPQPGERESLLRLVILYALALVGVATVLTSSGLALAILLRRILGEVQTVSDILSQLSNPVSIAIPLGGVWAYYGRQLRLDTEAMPDLPRRAGVRRLYYYILSAGGLISTFTGLTILFSFLIQAVVGKALWGTNLIHQLSNGLAVLATGFPLWWLTWRPMDLEAAEKSDAGEYARRSVVRKTYLYLALFAGVIGVMVSAGWLFYVVIRTLLHNAPADPLLQGLDWAQRLALFALWLGYHWSVLRRDGQQAERSLATRQAAYPVLVLDSDDGVFGQEVLAALQRHSVRVPVAVHPISQGVPDEEKSMARLVVLPTALVTQPGEAYRLWLENYGGERLIVPRAGERWQWMGFAAQTDHDLASQAAQAIRQMAEGQPMRLNPPLSAWTIMGYVFGGLFGLQLIFLITTLIISSLTR